MANRTNGIAGEVRKLLEPAVAELGYRIWNVEFVKEGADYWLRITIDSEKGITLDDCEAVNRAIDPILDEADPIEESYNLEVSSPGVERDLKTPEQIDFCKGWDVEIRLYAPDENGKKNYIGVLGQREEDGRIHVEIDGEDRVFEASAVAKLRTHYEF
ncbi:MAG: ribosome maturation factor RimP [Clostridia bacterium]|nr:ribosome maturation factor RimP [Clostridia bacterium]